MKQENTDSFILTFDDNHRFPARSLSFLTRTKLPISINFTPVSPTESVKGERRKENL